MPRALYFILYKYFPFGGLQRDFIRIAQACQAQSGCQINVLTLEWQGEKPKDWLIHIPPKESVRSLTSIGRYKKFTAWVQEFIHQAQAADKAGAAQSPEPFLVGFNKMPGLHVYYAADPCFAEKAKTQRSIFYRLSPRYWHFMNYEAAVFGPASETQILMISKTQQPLFERHYGTSEERMHMLPPGISLDRRAPENAAERRLTLRAQQGYQEDDFIILMIASDFRNKGLDRALAALRDLPKNPGQRPRLVVIGHDDARPYQKLAAAFSVSDQFQLLGPQEDIASFLLAADLLIHPARHENTGTVILEGLAAGLPVITTANCGYAHFVNDAQAGLVLEQPFDAQALAKAVEEAITKKDQLAVWRANALHFGQTADIYSMPSRAAQLILNWAEAAHG